MEQYTRPGLSAESVSYPRPNDSMVPVRKFSMRTSALATRRLSASTPSGCLRSSAMSRLLRLMTRYAADSPSLWGGHVRDSSPLAVSSTLMTSAPRSESSMAQKGPARTREQSTTRIPSRARAGWVMAPKITELPDPDHLQVHARGGLALPGVGSHEGHSMPRVRLKRQRRRDVHGIERSERTVPDQRFGASEDERCRRHEFPTLAVSGHSLEHLGDLIFIDVAGDPSAMDCGSQLDRSNGRRKHLVAAQE